MTDKILEAVKALGGNIENINSSDGDKSNYVALCVKGSSDGFVNAFRGEYWDVMGDFNSESFKKICTAEEFNTAAAEWLKEAYMHNAALGCGFDIDSRDKIYLVVNIQGIVYHHDVEICSEVELRDYCTANKPQSQIETPEEKEAFDMIEAKRKTPSEKVKDAIAEAKEIEAIHGQWNVEGLQSVGSKIIMYRSTECKRLDEFLNKEVEVIGISKTKCGKDVVTFSHPHHGLACGVYHRDYFRPLKSPRYKAVEAIYKARFNDDSYAMHSSEQYEFYKNAGLFVDWLKSLTPKQKKEFGL